MSVPTKAGVGARENAVSDGQTPIQSQIIANAAAGVYLVRVADGVIVFCNPKFEQMFGYGPAELVGQPVSVINDPNAADPHAVARAIMDELGRSGLWEGEVQNIRKDGTRFWTTASVSTFDHAEYGPVWVTVQHDIDQRKRDELELRRIYDMPRALILVAQPDALIVRVSAGALGVLGYQPEEMVGRPFYEFIHPDDVQGSEAEAAMLQGGGETFYFENRYRHKEGHYVTLAWAVSIDKETGLAHGLAQDTSERKASEEAVRLANAELDARVKDRTAELEASEEKHRAIIENLNDLIIILDEKGINLWNSPAVRQFGMKPEDAIGISAIEFAHVDDRERLQESLDYVLAHPGEVVTLESLRAETPQGVRYLNDTLTYLPDTPGIEGIVVVVHDNTANVEAQQKIEASLAEKEVLLKEIHHRVKNNLQVISGLLQLQEMEYDDDAIRGPLLESKNRVQSMALLHEQLYQSDDLGHIDLLEYVDTLVRHLSETFGGADKDVSVRTNVADLELGIDQAIPVGLILTELLSNAHKYAYPDGAGEVRLTIGRDGSQVRIVLEDDGAGLPEGFEVGEAKSLGLRLVRNLVKQLGGLLSIESAPGLAYTIAFPLVEETSFPSHVRT